MAEFPAATTMVTPCWLARLKTCWITETKPGKSRLLKPPPRLMFATSAPMAMAWKIPTKIALPGHHPVTSHTLMLMGTDHTRLTYNYSGRDFRLTDVAGEAIHDIIA